jgi:hypothetical protein
VSTPSAPQSRSYSTRAGRRSLHISAIVRSGPRKGDPELKYASSSGYTLSEPLHPAIPSSPTWSIDTLLDDQPISEPFTTEELLKLHKLAALRAPQNEAEMEKLKRDLAGSKRLIDAVRSWESGSGSGETVGMVDGRVAPTSSGSPVGDGESVKQGGAENSANREWDGTGVLDKEELLSKAGKTQGGYFVVDRHRQSE